MTANQIAYWGYHETRRSNKARERETHRHNKVVERETERHNRATEGIQYMQVVETRRANIARETYNQQVLDETVRHNTEMEALGTYEAETQRTHLEAMDAEAVRHNQTVEMETSRHNIAMEEETALHNRATEEDTDTANYWRAVDTVGDIGTDIWRNINQGQKNSLDALTSVIRIVPGLLS